MEYDWLRGTKMIGFPSRPGRRVGTVAVGDSAEQVLDAQILASYDGHSSNSRRSEGDDPEIERARSCDVFVGYCGGGEPLLMRFVKWLHAEMVMNGLLCFVSDRARCCDARDHEMAKTALQEATLGVVIVTKKSFSSPWNIEELKVLLRRKNLIPIFFGLAQGECLSRDITESKMEIWGQYGGTLWEKYGGLEGEWRKTVDRLSQLDVKLEVNVKNMRDCIFDAITLMGRRLGRRDVVEKLAKWKYRVSKEEFPLIRNSNFIGRKNELLDIKLMLFGDYELEGDNDFMNLIPEKGYRSKGESHQNKNKGKKSEPMVWKESNEEIEMEYEHNADHIDRFLTRNHGTRSARKRRANDLALGKGIACILGESGIGKTELLLEFAYMHSQMYKMVLWVNGETRYLRANYMNLLPHLGIDVNIVDNEFCSEKNSRNFEEIEVEAIRKVRKQLMRGIPYLLVIDNLESVKDYWDGRKIMELLPRFGGETHIIISSRLPKIMNIQPLRLSNLSSNEAMSLMMGHLKDIKAIEHDAIKIIEERLGRLPFGLGLVGAILSDNCVNPSKLLEAINRMPYREMQWSVKEYVIFRHNPFLVQFLDFLFLVYIRQKQHGNLAMRMMQVSGLFATSPIPVSILALATHKTPKRKSIASFWKKHLQMFACGMATSHTDLSKAEGASHVLVRFRLARCSPREGFISFHDITRVYVQKRGGDIFASAMVSAISIQGCLHQHLNHILAACFLLFKLNCSPVAVTLAVPDLLYFIQKFVLPLANQSFTSFSLCNLVLDLMRHSTKELEAVENFILANNGEVMSSFTKSSRNSIICSNPLLYKDLAHLRATLLETRAKFMLQCGEYEIGEQFCRTSLNIKEVIYGWEHPETQSTRKIMERFISFQSSSSVA